LRRIEAAAADDALTLHTPMLLFEFFPAVVALISVIVALRLILVDRGARQDPSEQAPHRVPPPRPPGDAEAERGSRRPSMSA
jgi:hypothetical protein